MLMRETILAFYGKSFYQVEEFKHAQTGKILKGITFKPESESIWLSAR
jgi:hypothetical protein